MNNEKSDFTPIFVGEFTLKIMSANYANFNEVGKEKR